MFDPQILARARYSRDDRRGRAGINQLLKRGVYEDAFPLHDGDYDYGDEEKNTVFMNHRRVRVSDALTFSHLNCHIHKIVIAAGVIFLLSPIDPVPGVGQVEELVPEAAPVADQEILRGQAGALLCLDGTLHTG